MNNKLSMINIKDISVWYVKNLTSHSIVCLIVVNDSGTVNKRGKEIIEENTHEVGFNQLPF